MAEKSKPIHWHSLLFWGSFAVAATIIVSAQFNKDKKPHWMFDEYGQAEFKKFVRYKFPSIGERWFPYVVHTPKGVSAEEFEKFRTGIHPH